MVNLHSTTAQSAYIDLLRLLRDEEVADIRGSVERRERKGMTYVYDAYRVGDKVIRRYLGIEDDEMRVRLERHEALRAERDTRRKERTRLVRLLRAEGYLSTDRTTGSLLAAMGRAGAFRLGAVMVGTAAFRFYEGELGIRLGTDQSAMTLDIDIASFSHISVALGDTVDPSLADVFTELKFDPVPALDGGAWRWKQAGTETLVEFLAPYSSDREQQRIEALGIEARSMRFMEFLLRDPIHAVALYRDGVLVRIPSPERYAIHKLIIANRRQGDNTLKVRKDLMQAELLIEVLAEDRPGELALAYEEATVTGPRWREHIDRSIRQLPDTADRLAAL